jgi:hypothetical protein
MPHADAPGGRPQRAALFAYLDRAAGQVVVETATGDEVARLDQAAAGRLGAQFLAAACDREPAADATVVAVDDQGEELAWRGQDGAELGRLGWLEALALAEELLAASRGEPTGSEPVPAARREADLVVFLPAAGRGLDDGVLAMLRRLHGTLQAGGLGGLGGVGGDGDVHDLVWWVDAAACQQAWEVVRAGLDEQGLLPWCRAVVYLAEGGARQVWPPEAPDEPASVAACPPAPRHVVRPGGGRSRSTRPRTPRPAPGPWRRRP